MLHCLQPRRVRYHLAHPRSLYCARAPLVVIPNVRVALSQTHIFERHHHFSLPVHLCIPHDEVARSVTKQGYDILLLGPSPDDALLLSELESELYPNRLPCVPFHVQGRADLQGYLDSK